MTFDQLDSRIFASPFLTNNPVQARVESGDIDRDALEYWLAQYVAFPLAIVTMLRAAQAVIAKGRGVHDAVVEEIERNLGEETGGRTHNVAHADLLIGGLERELKFRPCAISPCSATSAFVRRMIVDAATGSSDKAEGVVYALEATATPELDKVVRPLLQAYACTKIGRELNSASPLVKFIDIHVDDFEPGHHNGMRRALAERGVTEPTEDFLEGVEGVLLTMELWWHGLAQFDK